MIDKYVQKAGRPRKQMPGQELFAFMMTAILGKPGRQQQQRPKMIFWLVLLHFKLNPVFAHPLT